MTDGTRGVETDPSVCYRHPGRQSWVLCQRCGRTVCPECQILAPVGVHCPDCVAETSGGVQWRPAAVTPLKPRRRRAARSAGRVGSLLAGSGGTGFDLARAVLTAAIALFVLGLVCGIALRYDPVTDWLAGRPGLMWQLWRFVTAPLAYPAGLDLSILFFALSALFWWLTAPQVERMVGRPRFLAVVTAASVIGVAGTVLSGGAAYGLTSPLFGVFAALLVEVWQDSRVRTQIIVMIAINLLIAITSPGGLPALVGGMVGGAGTLWLLRTGPERGWKPRTPALIVVGVCAVFVLLAVASGGVGI